jgi:hypothetical protein
MLMKKVRQTLHLLVLPKRHDHRVHVRHHHPMVWQEQEMRQEQDHANGESECDFRPASIAAISIRQTGGMSLPGECQPLGTGQYKDIEDPESVFLSPYQIACFTSGSVLIPGNVL